MFGPMEEPKYYEEDGMIVYECDRLWGGRASPRSYVVEDCEKRNLGLKILVLNLGKASMTLSPKEVKEKKFRSLDTVFKSMINDGQEYFLWDYWWKEDKNEKTKKAVKETIEDKQQKLPI